MWRIITSILPVALFGVVMVNVQPQQRLIAMHSHNAKVTN